MPLMVSIVLLWGSTAAREQIIFFNLTAMSVQSTQAEHLFTTHLQTTAKT